jgi:drug/metabolite transporter (DMT)-like permease
VLIRSPWQPQLLIGGAALAVVAAVVEGTPAINWNMRFVVVLLFMALVGTSATTVAWFAEVRRARLDILTTWTLLVSVFGIALSIVLLNERQGVWGWVGTAVVFVSMVLLVSASGLARRSGAHPDAPSTHPEASDEHK